MVLLTCAVGLADLVGAGAPLIYRAVGLSLIAFAVGIIFLVRQQRPNPTIASLVSFADLGWVVGSVVLVAVGAQWFTMFGILAIASVALVVLAQLRGIRRVREAAGIAPGVGSTTRR